MLIAMAGLQGTGKSGVAAVLARELPAVLLTVDVIESGLARAGVEPGFGRGLAAYLVAEDVARENLRLGRHVVVDAANYVAVARDTWTGLARATGTPLLFVETVTRDLEVHRARIEGRVRDLPGFPEVTFADVVTRFSETEPWGDEPRLMLDTTEFPSEPAILAAVRAQLAAAGEPGVALEAL